MNIRHTLLFASLLTLSDCGHVNPDFSGPAADTISYKIYAQVVGHYLFYKNSSRYDKTATHDSAIALDKSPYVRGKGLASFSNVSSYALGINGIMIDISGPHSEVIPDDFIFRTGNTHNPNTWAELSVAPIVVTRVGAGYDGSDRIEITWPNHTIKNTWLEVTFEHSDLTEPDVFYFASSVGDTGSLPDDQITFRTGLTDTIETRNNPSSLLSKIPITNLYDFNRDGKVDLADELIVRNNPTSNLDAPKRLELSF